MDSNDESLESRHARMLRGYCGGDSETLSIVFAERWDACGDDYVQRSAEAVRAAKWLLVEMSECGRLARKCADGASPEVFGVFRESLFERVRRAAGAASRSLDEKAIDAELRDAIASAVDLCDRLASVERTGDADVESLDRACRHLAEAIVATERPPIGAALFEPPTPAEAGSPTPVDAREWLTVIEASRLTAIRKGTISKLCDSGQIESNGKRGQDRRVHAGSLARYMAERDRKS